MVAKKDAVSAAITTPRLALDHCGCIVRDLVAGVEKWQRLGFTLTPQSRQRGAVPGREGFHPWASANRCAILGRTYLELVGVVDESAFNPWTSLIARNEGLHILAVRCDDADSTYAALAARTDALRPPVPRERTLDVDGEARVMRFRNIFSRDEVWPEARYIVIEHQTPEYLWQSRYQHHENGARDLLAVTLVADDPSTLASRLHAFGCNVSEQSSGISATLPGYGTLNVMRVDAFADAYGHQPAARSGMHAMTIAFDDVAAAIDLMKARGTAVKTSPQGHWIGPNHTNGFVMHLAQSERAP